MQDLTLCLASAALAISIAAASGESFGLACFPLCWSLLVTRGQLCRSPLTDSWKLTEQNHAGSMLAGFQLMVA